MMNDCAVKAVSLKTIVITTMQESSNENRVFLITGASSGIGEEVARQAVQRGFRVVLAARRMDRLQELSKELGGEDHALPVRCNVDSWTDQQEMVGQAIEKFGCIDIILANAGIYISGGGFTTGNPEDWEKMIRTNVYGAGLTIRAGIGPLKRTKGHLMLLSSAASRRPIPGSMYGATKWAVTAMGHNVREELRGTGVRVTIVEPGVVNTPIFDTPRDNAMLPEDVAEAVIFAVSQPRRVDLFEILMYPTPPEE